MDELEELKKKRLAELQQNQQEQIQEAAQLQQQVAMIESMVKQKLTKDALQRYGNIKAVDEEKAIQALLILAQLIQTKNINQINDDQFKQILMKLQKPKKEFKIKRV